MKECAWCGDRTRGCLHTKQTRFRSSYRAPLRPCWSHSGKASSKISTCYHQQNVRIYLTKILTMENWPKSEVNRPCNIGHEVMALEYSCWSHKRYILIWNINLLSLVELKILPWTKILTLIIWPNSEVSGPWNIGHEVMALVYSCWSYRDTSSYEISTCYH